MKPIRRFLVVSASVGEGHDSAAEGVALALRRAWPGCEVRRVDSLEVMGGWVKRAINAVYRFQLRRAPWSYELFWNAFWWSRLFSRAVRGLVGWWCGRRLEGLVRAFGPDAIVSTYPVGSAALDWLRRRGLAVPTATYVPDFSAHPFWVFSGVDWHLVAHEAALRQVSAMGGRAVVVSPALRASFGPGSRLQARRRLGLREEAFVAVVTGGGWGVGRIEEMVRVLLGFGGDVQVVAVTGRNLALRQALEGMEVSRDRLAVLGYVDDMAEVLAASDVVVASGGGMTFLETFVSRRPLIICDPVPGHGRASARLISMAGLALYAPTPNELPSLFWRLRSDAFLRERLSRLGEVFASRRDLAEDLKALLEPLDVAGRLPSPLPAHGRPARPPIPRAAAMAAALGATLLLVGPGESAVAEKVGRPFSGALAPPGRVAIAVGGYLAPGVLEALAGEAAAGRGPATLFLTAEEVRSAEPALRAAEEAGWELEPSRWSGRRLARPGGVERGYEEAARALASLTGKPALFATGPGGRPALVDVAAASRLGFRWVIFKARASVGQGGLVLPSSLRPGTVVVLAVEPGASPSAVIGAYRALLAEVQALGLRPVRLDQFVSGASRGGGRAG